MYKIKKFENFRLETHSPEPNGIVSSVVKETKPVIIPSNIQAEHEGEIYTEMREILAETRNQLRYEIETGYFNIDDILDDCERDLSLLLNKNGYVTLTDIIEYLDCIL